MKTQKTECPQWDQGWQREFSNSCKANNWLKNNNPCNCHENLPCDYGNGEAITCQVNLIYDPCIDECSESPMYTCTEMMDACNCDPLDYVNDLHCDRTTTTTTTTTSANTTSPDSEDDSLLWLWIILSIVATLLLFLVLGFIWWRKRK